MFDKIVLNSKIYSLENENEFFEAMAISKGKIVKLFENEPGNASQLAKEILDANGKSIIPGMIDSHMHFMSTAALQEIALNVSEIKDGKLQPDNLDDFKDKIQTFAASKNPKKPILCFNYVVASLKEDRLPYWKELDEWVPDRFILVLSMDGHSSAYSSKALKSFGFDPNECNGILVGEDHEYNIGKINDVIMKFLDTSEIVAGVQNLSNEALDYGLVGLHCLDGFEGMEKDMSLWFLSKFGGTLPLYIRLFPQLRDVDRVKPFAKNMRYPRMGGCGGWEMDGSVGSQTAAFYEPYLGDPNNFGKLLFPQEEVTAAIIKAHKAGFQVTSHAIGTASIDVLLNSFSELYKDQKLTSNIYRHRVDHFEFPTKEQVNKAVDELGLLISAQPGYSWMDDLYQRSYQKYISEAIIQRQIPLNTIVKKGGYILGSSDSPVQHINPFIQISGMVNFPIYNEQLSMFDALRTYTYNGAYSTFEENERGTIAVGKNADFVILNEDPFEINKDSIAEITVDSTYIKGNLPKKMNKGRLSFLLGGYIGKKSKI